MNSKRQRGHSPDDERWSKVIGERIRSYRRIKHLTQTQLADRIGISTGPLNALEAGRHIPSGRVLARLSEILEVSMDALMAKPSSDAHTSGAQASTRYVADPREGGRAGDETLGPCAEIVLLPDDPPVNAAERIMLDRLVGAFLNLEDLCGAQKCAHIPLYHPFVANEMGIEELVGHVRQALGIAQGVIFDYLELLENAGLRIVFCRFTGKRQSLACYDRQNANAFFFVRADMNAERQIFELIKRLGAIYLHTRRKYGPAPEAKEPFDDLRAARKFAALFLMPAPALRSTVAQLGLDPTEWTFELLLRIKHRFGVSAQALLLRLRELGLIDQSTTDTLGTRIQRHYRKTTFAEPDGSRRLLNPNGRLGDLWTIACATRHQTQEMIALRAALDRHAVCEHEVERRAAREPRAATRRDVSLRRKLRPHRKEK